MKKILTFSFDDAVVQDRRLVALFNKYGVKGTFNIATGMLDCHNLALENDPLGGRRTISRTEVKDLYIGHEVAAHTLYHYPLPKMTDEVVIMTVEDNRKELSALVGYEVVGLAYPCAGETNNDHIAALIKQHTGIKYARTGESCKAFAPQKNLYRFNPTIWQGDYTELHRLWNEFLATASDEVQIFYVWGHSFEFDEKGTWDEFENFLRVASGREDVLYLTNREAFGIGELSSQVQHLTSSCSHK